MSVAVLLKIDLSQTTTYLNGFRK